MSNWMRKTIAQIARLDAYLSKHEDRKIRIDIYHDSWCRHNRGRSCNCDPDITFTDCGPSTPEERKANDDVFAAIEKDENERRGAR